VRKLDTKTLGKWLYNINIGTNEFPDRPYKDLPSTIESKP